MKLELFIASILCIVIPPIVMRILGKRILQKDIPEKEKMYNLMKAGILCLSGPILYFVAAIFFGGLDWASGIVEPLPLPEVVKALLFALILTFPMLVSIFLVIYEAAKVGMKITKERIEKKDVLEELALILGPIFAFAFIWVTLILYLPESLTSKWWFNLALYSVLIFLFFAFYPVILVKIGPTHNLDPELKKELLELCSRYGVKVRDIVVKGKPEHRGANAMVTGIIPGYRHVVLTHGLIKNFEKEEIKAVLAHEIGHIKEKHLWINALMSICWFLFWGGIIYGLSKLRLNIFSSPYFFFGIYFFAVFFWIFGIESWIIRRNEFKADEFAAKICGREVMIRALKKLAEVNLTPEKTGRWFNILSMHPSIEERIRHLSNSKEIPGEASNAELLKDSHDT